jgi:hypothetical protein
MTWIRRSSFGRYLLPEESFEQIVEKRARSW